MNIKVNNIYIDIYGWK